MSGRVTVVVGGQYGSEGKGVVVNAVVGRNPHQWSACVRSGGPNAGHTFHAYGRDFKQRMLPCSWPYGLKCYLSAGAVVAPLVFLREYVEASRYRQFQPGDVLVDGNAVILSEHDHVAEGGLAGEIHQRIGSTGEGVGEARIKKIQRAWHPLARHVRRGEHVFEGIDFVDFVVEPGGIRDRLEFERHKRIMLEGTQGSGLSLHHGHWPYVTSHDTTASTIAGDAGFGPLEVGTVIVVMRTFPIRVAGNSGPLRNETTWEHVSRDAGRPVIEYTTVTRKVRRVGEWDDELAKRAVLLNKPSWIFLNFADYLAAEAVGVTEWSRLPRRVLDFVDHVVEVCNVPVGAVGTGRRNDDEPFAIAWNRGF